MKNKLVFGSFSAAIAVALGAIGAHILKEHVKEGMLTQQNLESFEVAVRYQMYHAFALLLLAALVKSETALTKWTGRLFMIGTILFSGSVYVLSTRSLYGMQEGLKFLGPITPLGGICFITGWVLLGLHFLKSKHA